jgi:hypothetical protein
MSAPEVDVARIRGAGSGPGPTIIRTAALSYIVLGLGFGIGAAVTLWHLDRHGELPMTPWGFRSLDGGPFVQLSVERFTGLGWGLVAVCAADVISGVLLWQRRRAGAVIALITSPVSVVLGVGFALPFLLVGVPIRLALVLAGRRSLR